MAEPITREILSLISQLFDEEKYTNTMHSLEQESGLFFNMKYFEERVLAGEWQEVEHYLSGFTKVDQNQFSINTFFDIREQKYLEALDEKDLAKAKHILVNELEVFSSLNEELYKELKELLFLHDFREHKRFAKCPPAKLARSILFTQLKMLIEANPSFSDRLAFPAFQKSRLKELLNQSLNWQHHHCSNPSPSPTVQTLLFDHTCGPANGVSAPPPASRPLAEAVPNSEAFPSHGNVFQHIQPSAGPVRGRTTNVNGPTPHTAVTAGPTSLQSHNVSAVGGKRPISPPTFDYQSAADPEHLMKRPWHGGQAVEDLTMQVFDRVHGSGPSHRHPNEGSLLTVSSADDGIGIQANPDRKNQLLAFKTKALTNQTGPPEPAVCDALEVMTTAGASASGGPPLGGRDRPETTDRSSATVSTMARLVIDGPSLIIDQNPPLDSCVNDQNGFDNSRPQQVQNRRVGKDRTHTATGSKLTEIDDPSQCRSIRLRDIDPASKISKLTYTNSGGSILALCSSGVHKVWKWVGHEWNPSGHPSASFPPQRNRNKEGVTMTNDIRITNTTSEAVASIALANNDNYIMSASGGQVSIFNFMMFKNVRNIMAPPTAATFLAVHPQDSNISAIGMEDGTIQIFNCHVDEVKSKLEGHLKRITGLAFSKVLNVLVSLGADAQLCVWGTNLWEKQKSRSIKTRSGPAQTPMGGTRLQFHNDQRSRLLVLHESQLAIYDVATLKRILRWIPGDAFSASISDATYSCDSLLVYAGFADGSICVFDGDTLRPRCRISASVHIPSDISGDTTANPLVIAAHPKVPNQFALGLCDGGVQLLEPLESEGQWGVSQSSLT